MIEFEYALAKLAVEVGTARIRTVSGNEVEITDWKFSNNSIYPIRGRMYEPSRELWLSCSWTLEGKYIDEYSDIDWDLVIEEL